MLFMRSDVREGDGNKFILLQNVKDEQIPYKIVNECQCFDLDVNLFNARLAYKESLRFSWEDANIKERKLEIVLSALEDGFEKRTIEIHPDVVSSTCK